MKYKCLVLDHDDTVVNSTAQVHYPSFVEYLKLIRPNVQISFEQYMEENFKPGFLEFCYGKLGFTEEELQEEVKFWNDYVKKHTPEAYQGIKEVLSRYKNEGGIMCVVSHSFSENIKRDYIENGLPTPDMIFGWEEPKEKRKPSPYSIEQIMSKYNLKASDILVIDDLKPGHDMAQSIGVDFAAAGWAHEIPQISSYMKENSKYYLKSVKELEEIIF